MTFNALHCGPSMDSEGGAAFHFPKDCQKTTARKGKERFFREITRFLSNFFFRAIRGSIEQAAIYLIYF